MEEKKIKKVVKERYGKIAKSGESCCPSCECGPSITELGKKIGYSEKDLEDVKKYCKEFYIKTKDIISKITETQIESIRKKLKDFYTKRCK